MSNYSEFGKIIETVNNGNIISRDSGEVVFVSEAFNPLTAKQLLYVALKMLSEDLTIYTVPYHVGQNIEVPKGSKVTYY